MPYVYNPLADLGFSPVSTGSSGGAPSGPAGGQLSGTYPNPTLSSTALTAFSPLTLAANKLPYFTSTSAAATTDLTAFARTILDDPDGATVLNTIGAQPLDNELTALAGTTAAANKLPYFTSGTAASTVDFPSFARTFIAGATTSANARSILGTGSVNLRVKADYGAAGDARFVMDVTTTASSTTITSPTFNFTAADIGKTIGIVKAGAGTLGTAKALVTTIASINSTTSAELTTAATNSITGPRTVTDAAMAVGTTLTSATANFTAADIGKLLLVPGAADAGGDLRCRIVQINSTTSVRVSQRAITAVTGKTLAIPGAWAQIGTDDTAAIQAAVTASASLSRPVEVEPGRYLTTAQVNWVSGASMFGYGNNRSIFSPVGDSFSVFRFTGSLPTALNNVGWQLLEFDGSGLCASTYTTDMKALYCTFLQNVLIRDCYCHDFPATAIGNDFYVNSYIVNNTCIGNGRQADELGVNAGASGIGIGTGQYYFETLTVIGNTCRDNFNTGIFVESQTTQGTNLNANSNGIRIIGNVCIGNGNVGIGDHATDGTIIMGNQCERNGSGIDVQRGFAVTFAKPGLITGNIARYNNGIGINVGMQNGGYIITNNDVGFNTGAGFQYSSSDATGTPTNMVVENNQFYENTSRGLIISNGGASGWGNLYIRNNKFWNNGIGSSGAQRRAAIEIGTSVVNLYVEGNIAYDTRASAKWQSYGLNIASGTIGTLIYRNNDFRNNADGRITVAGTVTNWLPANLSSTATSLTLAIPGHHEFSGSSAANWTMYARADNIGEKSTFKNVGSANLTLTAAGSDNFYTSSASTTLVLTPGQAMDVYAGQTYLDVE